MANEEQAKYWAESAGRRWLANEQFLDASAQPFGLAAMDAADVKPGEKALDVGCGFGATTIELGRRTGPTGIVVGLDISPLLIGRAKEKAAEEGADNITFVEADAQTATIPDTYDLVFSRFGIMFFDDPVAAFDQSLRRDRAGRTSGIRMLAGRRVEPMDVLARDGGRADPRRSRAAATGRSRTVPVRRR